MINVSCMHVFLPATMSSLTQGIFTDCERCALAPPAHHLRCNQTCGDGPLSAGPPCPHHPDSENFQLILQLLPLIFYSTIMPVCCSYNEDGTSISIPPLQPARRLAQLTKPERKQRMSWNNLWLDAPYVPNRSLVCEHHSYSICDENHAACCHV